MAAGDMSVGSIPFNMPKNKGEETLKIRILISKMR
jgi:hypothetical protein